MYSREVILDCHLYFTVLRDLLEHPKLFCEDNGECDNKFSVNLLKCYSLCKTR
ncbi:unnamed protein product [Moneuplotes crassus]|uniref:Uncharacterized protein n=1 Tax=Euplotes crassus TaxID=5936 RepID=A0AAD1URS9_EUPCR|nr:unnamed protein product [Moneuplotes crassus]